VHVLHFCLSILSNLELKSIFSEKFPRISLRRGSPSWGFLRSVVCFEVYLLSRLLLRGAAMHFIAMARWYTRGTSRRPCPCGTRNKCGPMRNSRSQTCAACRVRSRRTPLHTHRTEGRRCSVHGTCLRAVPQTRPVLPSNCGTQIGLCELRHSAASTAEMRSGSHELPGFPP